MFSEKVEGRDFMVKRKERVKNVVIIVMMAGFLVSSIAGTFLLAVQNNDQQTEAEKQAEALKAYQEQQKQQEAIVREPLEGYKAESFSEASVKELKVETLKEGDGKAATAQSTVSANYFGWTADGKIFDSSNRGGTTTPVEFALNEVIAGWTKGLTGIKEGSVVKLLIPGDMAYGNQDDGTGRPFGPLAFIVELKEVK